MDQKKLRELTKKEKERRDAPVKPKARRVESNALLAKRLRAEPEKRPAAQRPEGEPEAPQVAEQVAEMEEEVGPESKENEVNEVEEPVVEQTLPKKPEVEEDKQDKEEEDQKEGLPEGFFDDPDMDAKMRGQEAPSKKAERELEEGLRRFEREMQAEQERAEEKRHQIDEEKYEATAVEEQEFQVQLQSRLEKLRQQTAHRKLNMPKEAEKEEEPEDDEDLDDDDLDGLSLDWRAKGFS